jgi:hypothetical protein
MTETCEGYQGEDCDSEVAIELEIEHGMGRRTERLCEQHAERVKTDISVPQSDEDILTETQL